MLSRLWSSTSAVGGGSGASVGGFLRQHVRYVYYAMLIVYLFGKRVYAAEDEVFGSELKPPGRYEVAKFNFDHVSDVYAITLWILLGSLAKVGFHLSHKLTEKFPESCLLIILGLVVGGLLYATKLAEQKAYVLNSDTFFLFLLPPIILEAGYFMPNRPFFDNIGTILLFAIANTLFNTMLIGLTLWGFTFTPLYGGVEFEMLHCFVFAALISAVDPVAVLATFVEIHVNDMLYIVVFGESLLNDAVSVVLYRMFDAFADMGAENIIPVDIVLGGTSFLIVAFGGVLIGIVFGLIACFTTKFTEHTPVLEPLIILTYSYLSYLTAEMFSTSGILAITFCGMFMKQYVEFNISKKSNATIEYVLKMLASIMETIIFMFMGLSTVSDHHSWNTGFVLITLFCCTFYRILGVLVFANIANRWRLLELTLTDMLIMSYGGIRGAVAFALALILDESKIPRKKEFVTATIAVVFFTVFVQGTTIGPIVKYFKVKRKEFEEPTMSAKLTNRLIDHIMSCLEDIAGVNGKHSLRDKVRTFDRKFFKPFLLREKILSRDEKLLSTFQKIKELNVNKMAENPEFVFPTSASMAQLANLRNESIGNFFNGHRLSELVDSKTVPDFQKLEIQPSKRADEDARIHHMLDTAMFDPRRKQAVHKRSQLDEDTTPFRRSSRSRGYSSGGAGGGGGGGGGISGYHHQHNQTFHHQNPLMMRPMIDLDNVKGRYKPGSGGAGGAPGGKKQRAHHHHHPATSSSTPGGGGANGQGGKGGQSRSSSAHPAAATESGLKSPQHRSKSSNQAKMKQENVSAPKNGYLEPLSNQDKQTASASTAAATVASAATQAAKSQVEKSSAAQLPSKFFVETEETRPASPNDVGLIPPPWKSSSMAQMSEEPVLANMPTWANNPNYTLHATSTKPEQQTHKAVFDIFDYDDTKSPPPSALPSSPQQQHQGDSGPNTTNKPDPTTSL